MGARPDTSSRRRLLPCHIRISIMKTQVDVADRLLGHVCQAGGKAPPHAQHDTRDVDMRNNMAARDPSKVKTAGTSSSGCRMLPELLHSASQACTMQDNDAEPKIPQKVRFGLESSLGKGGVHGRHTDALKFWYCNQCPNPDLRKL